MSINNIPPYGFPDWQTYNTWINNIAQNQATSSGLHWNLTGVGGSGGSGTITLQQFNPTPVSMPTELQTKMLKEAKEILELFTEEPDIGNQASR